MSIYVGCDAHKRYSVFAAMSENGQVGSPIKDKNFVFALATNASQFSPFSTHRHPEIRLSLPKWRGQ
jgi:hypothetical protein